MTTILITGGAGFIGSNFIDLLLRERPSWRVVCVDALTYAANPNTLNFALGRDNFVFYKEDIRNRDGIFSVFRKERPDVVVNFAAESHVDRSIDDPTVFLETNVLGTQVLMDACRQFGVRRFHQISTDEVYGDLPLERPDAFFREDAPLRPSSPYAVSKASADLLALAYHRTYGLPVTVSRSANNYGPYQFPEKLIPLTIYNASHDRPVPIYGDGLNVRDWLHVADHCMGILAVLEKGKVGEVYNFGGNHEKTNLDVVTTILNTLGKPTALITHVADRKGHDKRYAMDCTKAMTELGWQPTTPFLQGVKTTVEWYARHTAWLDECTAGEYVTYCQKIYGNTNTDEGKRNA